MKTRGLEPAIAHVINIYEWGHFWNSTLLGMVIIYSGLEQKFWAVVSTKNTLNPIL